MSVELSSAYVMALDDRGADLAAAGGKGASLAALARAGLPVPPGFHVTTAAYRHFVERHGLQDRIVAAAGAQDAAGRINEVDRGQGSPWPAAYHLRSTQPAATACSMAT
jgi:rifampicin phosphotransferase